MPLSPLGALRLQVPEQAARSGTIMLHDFQRRQAILATNPTRPSWRVIGSLSYHRTSHNGCITHLRRVMMGQSAPPCWGVISSPRFTTQVVWTGANGPLSVTSLATHRAHCTPPAGLPVLLTPWTVRQCLPGHRCPLLGLPQPLRRQHQEYLRRLCRVALTRSVTRVGQAGCSGCQRHSGGCGAQLPMVIFKH